MARSTFPSLILKTFYWYVELFQLA